MTLYFDTAAVVKFFTLESGSEQVSQWILSGEHELWLCELAMLEFRSAMLRKKRNHEITPEAFMIAWKSFQHELPRFEIEPLSRLVLREAENLMETYGHQHALRALDALHVAAFTMVADDDWRFVTDDLALINAIKGMGYKTLIPLDAHF